MLDEHARTAGLSSRSAAVQAAIALLRHADLEQQYEIAFTGWDGSEDAALWDSIADDGLS